MSRFPLCLALPISLVLVLALAGCGETSEGEAVSALESEAGADAALPDAHGLDAVSEGVEANGDNPLDQGVEASADAGAETGTETGPADAPAEGSWPATGTFHALTYNVAGLPQGISSSDPAKNTPLISPKLNAFDLVMAQEDFAYHAQLVSQVVHPWITSHKSGSLSLGDGVTTLSMMELGADVHVPWNACSGYVDQSNDCLTPKGFVVTTMTLAPGVEVDMYNLHADAGGSSGDMDARSQQMDQLVAYIQAHSAGRALIVGGDTNMHDEDEAQLQKLVTGAGLDDACRVLSCPEPYRIDRLMFRSGGGVTLTVTDWHVDWTFVDADGEQLSDHEPVAVDFTWSAP